ncbi:Biosynthetic Aromatic amino acid aminotransferase beta [hydrothermal vent metagenome]|uniref:Biosynthetic Aromatic amino acid aminotransferase beta n=1 Tax=hydrothermal vent metagenome TaxID=652676 RepID=A0A3B1CMX3_9ZZZZ
MIKVSKDISQIKPYSPGKPISELERELGIMDSIKLASNENPLGPSKKALHAIRKALKEVGRYPDGAGFSLKDALASYYKVEQNQIVLGNGSNEIIELLIRTFVMPGDEVVIAHPSFSVYRLIVQAGHGKSVEVPLIEGVHDLQGMAKAITKKTKLVFVCNPNNPTGTIVGKSEVDAFLSEIPKNVLVVFDEAYAEYVTDENYPDSFSLLRKGAPIILLRTFSKIYGLAGLRIGYGISHPKIIDYLNRVRQPFNSNLPAQVGALAALSDEGHFQDSRTMNEKGKRYLSRQFDLMGLSYFPSQANFIYFYLQGKSSPTGAQIQDALLKQGVIIRHLGGSSLRVTIGRQHENKRFINALRCII